MWEWHENDYCLNEATMTDISHCLWDEVSQSEDSLMFILEEQTPIKDCTDFSCQTVNIEDNINKLLEECRESSQKRRRVLHFPRDSDDIDVCNAQSSSVFLRSKEREEEQMDNGPSSSANVEWSSHWHLGLPDGGCAFNSEAWDEASEGWLDDCLDSNLMQCKIDEAAAPINDQLNCDEVSSQEVQNTELSNLSEVESDLAQQESIPSPLPKLLKVSGRRKSIIGTSVAYPFALIKPCGAEGGLTLKDINQRLHNPLLPSITRQLEGEDPSLSYPTSAFSGKPVVVKTKIHTEGGKGSITIMRTKG